MNFAGQLFILGQQVFNCYRECLVFLLKIEFTIALNFLDIEKFLTTKIFGR